MQTLFYLVLTYLVGSIPFGLLLGKVWGKVDVRTQGSGNIGATNVARTVGWLPALLVFILDVLKGWAPVAFAPHLNADPSFVAIVAVAAVLGHVGSIFLRFSGGKGIATTFGAMLGLDPWIGALLLGIWLLVLFATRYVSVASLAGAVGLPIFIWLLGHPAETIAAGAAISAIAAWRHRGNVKRLRSGKEFRIGERAGRAERR